MKKRIVFILMFVLGSVLRFPAISEDVSAEDEKPAAEVVEAQEDFTVKSALGC